jgi:hypothetical protein
MFFGADVIVSERPGSRWVVTYLFIAVESGDLDRSVGGRMKSLWITVEA